MRNPAAKNQIASLPFFWTLRHINSSDVVSKNNSTKKHVINPSLMEKQQHLQEPEKMKRIKRIKTHKNYSMTELKLNREKKDQKESANYGTGI